MKNSVYYIKLYFNSKNILEEDIFSFLDSLNKIKSINFFFIFLDGAGLHVVKKMKKIQKRKKFNFCAHPLIYNEEERKLIKHNGKDEQVLLVVINHYERSIKKINNIVNAHKKYFYKIDKKNTEINKVDVVTPAQTEIHRVQSGIL